MIRAIQLSFACLVVACASVPDGLRRHAAPVASTVRIAPRVSLEVLEWGGHGEPVVFLAGSGSTAHVFDDFAPQFADSFRVIGITRRGYGASGGFPPRDLDTLVADITSVLDTIGIDRVVLVGHSIAGEEMTRFAELHSSRCAGLVYLDAAYDRSGIDTMAARQPSQPAPRIRAADTATFKSVRALYARVMGVDEPASEIRATTRFDAADRYQGQRTADSLRARLASAPQVARYDRAHCRALAIYAVPDSIADVIPYYAELDSVDRVRGDALLSFVKAVVADSRAVVARFPQNEIVDIHGGNHFVFLQRPGEVARAMRAFLSKRVVTQP